jgi:uncharacterized membrane protein (DUF373 family)
MIKKLLNALRKLGDDDHFLHGLHLLEKIIAKILSLALIVVILVAVVDLILFLFQELITEPVGFFNTTLLEIFGLFLNILIALEILENLTANLQKNIIFLELVIVTSLVAVSRKIIIFDLEKKSSLDLIALGVAILALSVSYWLIKSKNTKDK